MLNDARTYQILFLSTFLTLGMATRDWTLQPSTIGVAIATCLITQSIGLAITQGWLSTIGTQFLSSDRASPQASTPTDHVSPALDEAQNLQAQSLKLSLQYSLPSALITALGLSLLLRVDHNTTMVLAGVAAISSKFLLRFKEKHWFNPANVGIVVALTLTQDAWVSPGQWGEEGWYALLFLGLGGVVLQRVGRWDTSVAFLVSYAGLEAARNIWLGWTWDVWLHRLMSGSLLLFALFMVTDPRTIPNARIGRLIWAVSIAILAFILRNYFFISTAVFWSLFMLSPLSVLFDMLFPADNFSWRSRSFMQNSVTPSSVASSNS